MISRCSPWPIIICCVPSSCSCCLSSVIYYVVVGSFIDINFYLFIITPRWFVQRAANANNKTPLVLILLSNRRLSKDSRRYYCCVPMLRRLPPIAQSSYCQLLWRLLLHPAVLKDWPRTSPRGVAFMLQCFFTFIGAHKIEKDWRFQYNY